jgi:hypothetical protein
MVLSSPLSHLDQDRPTGLRRGTFFATTDGTITQSMNRPGKMTDNAFIESFFHSMKADVFHGCRFNDDSEVRSVLKDYLPFYNRARLHSSLDYVSPVRLVRFSDTFNLEFCRF